MTGANKIYDDRVKYSPKESYSVLTAVKDYLISKKERANLFIEFIESRFRSLRKNRDWRKGVPYTEREWEIAEKIRELNKKGPDYGLRN